MRTSRLGLLAFVTMAAAAVADAQLASWELTGVNSATSNPFTATSVASHVASASLSLGSGVTTSSGADTFGGSNFDTLSLAAAISGADYISFTITPSAGYNLSITSISLNSGVALAVTSFHGDLLSSVTGFAAADSLHSYSFSTQGAPVQSITLSGVSGLQSVSGPLEFRLYGWRDIAGTSTFRIRNLANSDLVINGSLATVPEPSTYATLLGLLALASVIIRRRRWPRAA